MLGIVIFWGYGRIIRLWREGSPVGDLMLAYFLVGVITNLSEASFFRNSVPAWLFFMMAVTMPVIREVRSMARPIRTRLWNRETTQVEGQYACNYGTSKLAFRNSVDMSAT